MSRAPIILLTGTADTKSTELLFMHGCIEEGGSHVVAMDAGMLDGAPFAPDTLNTEAAPRTRR